MKTIVILFFCLQVFTGYANCPQGTDMPKDEKLKQRMLKLKKRYAAKLPGKIKELISKWQQLLKRPDDKELLEEVMRQAHTLAGSAGTFGYTKIAEVAKNLQLILKGLVARDDDFDGPQQQKGQSYIRQLTQLMEEDPVDRCESPQDVIEKRSSIAKMWDDLPYYQQVQLVVNATATLSMIGILFYATDTPLLLRVGGRLLSIASIYFLVVNEVGADETLRFNVSTEGVDTFLHDLVPVARFKLRAFPALIVFYRQLYLELLEHELMNR
ncbi:MAG: Hpt domain-containing protein [Bacteriovoracaceae bacterium]|nr:Hpt domain-containing protein [Bacteriovoracaceae bacterium]